MNSHQEQDNSNRIPLRKALLWIFFSVLIISGSCFVGLLYYQHIRDNRRHDPKYQITALIQTSQDKEGLKTVYLAELLELSIDSPMNLYAFNSKEAREKLLRSAVIKEASISKIRPGIIWVNYTLRKPIAILGDYTNTMIDVEGIPFPIKPIFTPKKLPEIYLGIDESIGEEDRDDRKLKWGAPLQGKRINLAFALLNLIMRQCCSDLTHLSYIDVSKAFALSYGQRQIVVILEDRVEKEIEGQPVLCVYPRILRLGTDNYEQQLKNYLVLQSYSRQQDSQFFCNSPGNIEKAKATIVDLRLQDLAFITNEP